MKHYISYCALEVSTLILTGVLMTLVMSLTGIGVRSTFTGVEVTWAAYAMALPAYALAAFIAVTARGGVRLLWRMVAASKGNTRR